MDGIFDKGLEGVRGMACCKKTTRTLAASALMGACVFTAGLQPVVAATLPSIASLGEEPQTKCGGLRDFAQGKVKIDSADFVGASPISIAPQGPTPAARISPETPSFCKVLGHIDPLAPDAPPIRFEVNLPIDWNGRSVQYGGGGFNGVLITGLGHVPAARFDQPTPLARGFVTYGTDSGHMAKPGEMPYVFALNDEAFLNFAHLSYNKVRDAGVAIMIKAYGRAPEKLYFMGSSEGGREGLTMAQRYPNDFDGILSRVPVINWTGLQAASARAGVATMGDAYLTSADVKLLNDAVLGACKTDGRVINSVVLDAVGCKAQFNAGELHKLRCPEGAKSAGCLTDAQITAINTIHGPYDFPFALEHGGSE
jgi:feruloyl esterase